MEFLVPIGRILFSLVFILSGMNHLTKTDAMTGYAVSKGMPAARASVIVSGVLIVLCGLAIMLGIWARVAALILVFFLLATSFIFHAFWKEQDPQQQTNEMTHFLKDMALCGAALLIFYFGSGPLSLVP